MNSYLRDFSKELRRSLANGADMETSLQALRAAGATIFESMAAVRSVRPCDLAEAKRLVHYSKTWTDVREETERTLRREFEESAEPGASPNGGPGAAAGGSAVSERPPSVT